MVFRVYIKKEFKLWLHDQLLSSAESKFLSEIIALPVLVSGYTSNYYFHALAM